MNKEDNKNKIIKELSEENDNLRAIVEYQKQVIEGLEAFGDSSVAQYPLEAREAIAQAEEAKMQYENLYREALQLKKEIETEYREKFEEALQQITGS